MPAGRVSMQATLASQGRSASALIARYREAHGDAAIRKVAGLDPRAFELAVRAAKTDRRLMTRGLRQMSSRRCPRRIVGRLAQIPFTTGTEECASSPPRSMPPACALLYPADMISRRPG